MNNTSKFITGLLNSLEIITCISLSSCDTKQKNKTEDERYKKNSILKALETLKKPQLTAEQKNNIADFCVNNDIQNLKKLTLTNLEHILQDQKLASSVLNSIWIYVLNELNVNEFEILNDFQKEKIAQMFIDETIDISDNNTIKSNLSRYKKTLEGHKQPTPPTQNTTDTTTPPTQAPGFAKKKVNVNFVLKNKYSVDKGEDIDIKDFATLAQFVKMVSDKNVSVEGNKKFTFTVNDGNTILVTVDNLVSFNVEVSISNFNNLLKHVKTLKDLQLVDGNFKFKVEANSAKSCLKFGEIEILDGFLITESAWIAIKSYKELFDLGGGIIVSPKDRYGHIGNLNLNFGIFDKVNKNNYEIMKIWKGIFTKKINPNTSKSNSKK